MSHRVLHDCGYEPLIGGKAKGRPKAIKILLVIDYATFERAALLREQAECQPLVAPPRNQTPANFANQEKHTNHGGSRDGTQHARYTDEQFNALPDQ
ncbi:hypothetical protein EWM64_g8523 [Hericium alpestre]|uniref:Uncharacterized protein n=1 Tax=Hericium alpestre TaxID=135208 RepID=A0A4Y9ZPR1_9AGAM|nr:hypothetical protein EWM64_g8523 [Hericium alpestre]